MSEDRSSTVQASALDIVNRLLSLDALITSKGDEIKCWTFDDEVIGRVKTYFDARNCKALSEAFAVLAEALTHAEARHG